MNKRIKISFAERVMMLVCLLESKGLRVRGNKDDLVARLLGQERHKKMKVK